MKINQAFDLLQRAGGIRAARIITQNQTHISRIRVLWMCHKLRQGYPVAKIVHNKWFYGLAFYTNRYTLDPRPDTETLVQAVISDCRIDGPRRILDLGTGTGCIICAIVKNVIETTGVGVDLSRGARRVARRNVKNLGIENRIKIIRGDFANPKLVNEKFDIIVSNPPYIAYGDERVDDGAKHDPKMALYAHENGLFAYKMIAKNARAWLHPMGRIYLEIGDGQTNAVCKIFQNAGWKCVDIQSDLAGVERVLVFTI